jgi:predicted DNA-binding transcriptional regulator YafY
LSRAQRLLDLIQLLRQRRRPVAGAVLASQLGTSLRTLYRDIETLKAQGADIEGEAGLGYILRSGFLLPPLMFTQDEIEAVVLGSRWVAKRADDPLAEAAKSALAKIAAVLPEGRKADVERSALLVGPASMSATARGEATIVRRAIDRQQKLQIRYADGFGNASDRKIWPLALSFFDNAEVIVAWCEQRDDYRHFRIDRLLSLVALDELYSGSREKLLRLWREREKIPPA